jgi:hypothetical protein
VIRPAARRGGARLLFALVGVAALAAACDFHYRAVADQALDEVVVQAIPSANLWFDHPARLSAQELTSILQEVRVEFKSHWLQRLVTGKLEPAPLFDQAVLARVVPLFVEALEKAGAHDRIVFYVAQRRASNRRDVTSGTLFVKGRSLTIVLANHQNRVDVVPGLAAYDRQNPEMAVAPQRFLLVFARTEFVVDRASDLTDGVFETALPRLMVDYVEFLAYKSRTAIGNGS